MLTHISKTQTLGKFTPKPKTSLDWRERLITNRQLGYIKVLAYQQGISIQALNNNCYRRLGADLATMKRPDASDLIQALERGLMPM